MAPNDVGREIGPRRALTVKQPWATLLVAGVKDVENRSWSTNHRGPLWIHAGKGRDAPPPGVTLDESLDYPTGVLLGTVDLVDIIQDSTSQWGEPGSYHWVVQPMVALARPIPMRGRLGLWTLPDCMPLAE